MPSEGLRWWQRTAIYQIYPRSFSDSNGDGVGDLRGITQRLDHVSSLGAGAIWISPFYPSPMADFGYDVSDYTDVDPVFGTLDDFDELLADAHRRDIRVIVDWVPNHTSDQHPWFLESRSSRDNPKRDWYTWRDPGPGGAPPNNWQAAFKAVGPAWTFDETTGQYYLHSFCRSSRISTGRTRRWRRRCTTSCGSGLTAAWTAFASTWCRRSPRTRSSATT
jgi:alpha-glucosidase